MKSDSWLVSPRFDLWVFLAPAVLALALAWTGPILTPTGETTLPLWILTVLLVDVAHVWSTIYRTYLDPAELRRRPALYVSIPSAVLVLGVLFYSVSAQTFWRALAYLAVWHFVRQQYGWVALLNRKAKDRLRIDRWIDAAAIYASTVFPILWWHAHLPRRFDWFLPGDFIRGVVSPGLIGLLWPIYLGSLLAFVVRQLWRWRSEGVFRPGKVIVVATTALCWGMGIILTNTDWSFTVTNVLIHGVPYMAFVWHYGQRSAAPEGSFLAWILRPRHIAPFYGLLVLLAYLEETGWDRLVWHEHPGLFLGGEVALGSSLEILVVPLLALPQATHYLLDAWIWKRRFMEAPVPSP